MPGKYNARLALLDDTATARALVALEVGSDDADDAETLVAEVIGRAAQRGETPQAAEVAPGARVFFTVDASPQFLRMLAGDDAVHYVEVAPPSRLDVRGN